MSFAVRPNGSSPSNAMRIVFGFACGSVCVASTCSTSDVPMPNASAPNAPCVEVWLSPQTIVIPGCVRPSSGPITCTIPSRPLPVAKSRTPNSSQFCAQRLELRARERVGDRPGERRDVVVHRRDGEVGAAHGAPGGAQPLERLRARHLVHEVQVDVEERAAIVVGGDDVRVPDLLEERAHRSRSAA